MPVKTTFSCCSKQSYRWFTFFSEEVNSADLPSTNQYFGLPISTTWPEERDANNEDSFLGEDLHLFLGVGLRGFASLPWCRSERIYFSSLVSVWEDLHLFLGVGLRGFTSLPWCRSERIYISSLVSVWEDLHLFLGVDLRGFTSLPWCRSQRIYISSLVSVWEDLHLFLGVGLRGFASLPWCRSERIYISSLVSVWEDLHLFLGVGLRGFTSLPWCRPERIYISSLVSVSKDLHLFCKLGMAFPWAQNVEKSSHHGRHVPVIVRNESHDTCSFQKWTEVLCSRTLAVFRREQKCCVAAHLQFSEVNRSAV